MKNVLKVEEFGLLLLFSVVYFEYLQGGWGLYLGLFFLPDLAFFLYLINPKWGAIGYNFLHHKGVMALVILLGLYLQNDLITQIGFVFYGAQQF